MRGFRIELGEVEAALCRASRACAEAVVLVREDGPGDRRLVAYVVPRPAAAASGELRAWLRERLPEYMVPGRVRRPAGALPLTPNGKVDRRALPAPEPPRRAGDGLRPPRTPLEELLAEIWARCWASSGSGVHDSFFDLGGHSLLATQVLARLQDVARRRAARSQALFERPTVRRPRPRAVGTQQRGGEADGGAAARSRRPPARGPPPLSFAQQRLWLLDRLEPGGPAYNMPFGRCG